MVLSYQNGEHTVQREKDEMASPEGISVDQEGNVYVDDTGNNHILGFASRSPILNVYFSSEDGEIYGNDTRIKIEPIYDGLKSPTADIMWVVLFSFNLLQKIVNRYFVIMSIDKLRSKRLHPCLVRHPCILVLNCLCLDVLRNDFAGFTMFDLG